MSEMADHAIARLRGEVRSFFGMAADTDIDSLLASSIGQDTVWNYLAWAEWEWRYGWPQAVDDALCGLHQARAKPGDCLYSFMDFGSGIGEVPLYVGRYSPDSITLADRPGEWRDFLAWRCMQRRLRVPVDPEAVLADGAGPWHVVMALEVLEHIPEPEGVLRALAAKAKVALIVSGAMGRPESDRDPLHVYRDPIAPQLLNLGFGLWRGGGMPWVFVRRQVAAERGLQLIALDGTPLVEDAQ